MELSHISWQYISWQWEAVTRLVLELFTEKFSNKSIEVLNVTMLELFPIWNSCKYRTDRLTGMEFQGRTCC